MATYNRIAIMGNELWASRESKDQNFTAVIDIPEGSGVTVHSFDPIDDLQAVARISIVQFLEQYEDEDPEPEATPFDTEEVLH